MSYPAAGGNGVIFERKLHFQENNYFSMKSRYTIL